MKVIKLLAFLAACIALIAIVAVFGRTILLVVSTAISKLLPSHEDYRVDVLDDQVLAFGTHLLAVRRTVPCSDHIFCKYRAQLTHNRSPSL